MVSSQNNVTLTELHVIEDESEYVFVKEDLDHGELFDDESYDHCDLSPDLSCATSVATEVTLKDLNLSLVDETAEFTTVPPDEERDEDDSKKVVLDSSNEGGVCDTENEKRVRENSFDKSVSSSASCSKSTGSRLSNKKRRKKLKMMKKQQAAAAALATINDERNISNRNSAANSLSPRRRSKSNCSSSSSMRRYRMSNVAVACAHDSLASYREEVQGLVAM
mmetsp:Transcript_21891/g.46022  ORF Transcript_21891/g.46022 Transcript_21891/m.46022 type:complete len:222 (+) Transcript_21891:208-873(+)|eukprot:CAMPEP_0171327858 /NCGR_PEP_ID=MMETSP0878-20121228/288_1 /TAXON_ID=67004 /ORGANISM="Thalassiosira weissflogii, Strain CCMP1336" /LENGTH=221 /DNA_ID=CAMNT_0011827663 /DNA_START=196 /DNA_END=861 /DNA_ORIENTATION=-